jgi:hypothetical protein
MTHLRHGREARSTATVNDARRACWADGIAKPAEWSSAEQLEQTAPKHSMQDRALEIDRQIAMME